MPDFIVERIDRLPNSFKQGKFMLLLIKIPTRKVNVCFVTEKVMMNSPAL